MHLFLHYFFSLTNVGMYCPLFFYSYSTQYFTPCFPFSTHSTTAVTLSWVLRLSNQVGLAVLTAGVGGVIHWMDFTLHPGSISRMSGQTYCMLTCGERSCDRNMPHQSSVVFMCFYFLQADDTWHLRYTRRGLFSFFHSFKNICFWHNYAFSGC